jgi:hypothetical protein
MAKTFTFYDGIALVKANQNCLPNFCLTCWRFDHLKNFHFLRMGAILDAIQGYTLIVEHHTGRVFQYQFMSNLISMH